MPVSSDKQAGKPKKTGLPFGACPVSEGEKRRFVMAIANETERIEKGWKQPFSGINTYCEKIMHRVMKDYCEPVGALQEKKIGNFYADIFNEDGITEIQTGSFYPLRKKIGVFLPYAPLRIVHPIVSEKTLCWLNPETGELTRERKSPKHGDLYDGVQDLYWIAEYLNHPNLTVEFLFLSADEIRRQDGWGKEGKRGSHREVLKPRELLGKKTIQNGQELSLLLPSDLPDTFTVKDLRKKLHRADRLCRTLVKLWVLFGIVGEAGKAGRSMTYKISERE